MAISALHLAIWALVLLIPAASGGVVVTKTDRGPTGYEVTITYRNATARAVTLGGGLPAFTDQWRTTSSYGASLDPRRHYRPGDFPSSGGTYAPVFAGYPMNMTARGNDTDTDTDTTWIFSAPFPSGTYTYSFLSDCAYAPNCTDALPDPDNPPFETVPGSQTASVFQVPFDARFQSYPDMRLDWDYALPVPAARDRGVVEAATYASPGSVSPAPGVHDFAVYLPAGYYRGNGSSNSSSSSSGGGRGTYPVLYLSHGGGGTAGDWPTKAKVGNILDRLIRDGHIEPTVVVMPTFTGLTADSATNWNASLVRELYQTYLFPHIEATYAVSRSPSRRAFAGLSLGSALTYEMYANATADFGYYGLFSGALLPGAALADYVTPAAVAANPALADRGLLVGYGQYDIAFDDARLLQTALDACRVKYVSRFAPWGFHAWNTWQDSFWWFGRLVLWKERPFGDLTGHGA
ncbi:carbohydrate esterase family 1 protein [Xylariaceae sp. FL0804]|nr:carbohydrate esterase family 1 protein [Xylariaceae sp. FL0804]